jgi:hypothetical protein
MEGVLQQVLASRADERDCDATHRRRACFEVVDREGNQRRAGENPVRPEQSLRPAAVRDEPTRRDILGYAYLFPVVLLGGASGVPVFNGHVRRFFVDGQTSVGAVLRHATQVPRAHLCFCDSQRASWGANALRPRYVLGLSQIPTLFDASGRVTTSNKCTD